MFAGNVSGLNYQLLSRGLTHVAIFEQHLRDVHLPTATLGLSRPQVLRPQEAKPCCGKMAVWDGLISPHGG